jgi:hypothetical protein
MFAPTLNAPISPSGERVPSGKIITDTLRFRCSPQSSIAATMLVFTPRCNFTSPDIRIIQPRNGNR